MRRTRTADYRLTEAETETRFIGSAIPLEFHEKLRQAAAKEGIALATFLRRACLDRIRQQEITNNG